METALRTLALLQILLAAFFACGAANVENESKRCRTDALDKWYCASDPGGSAVVDELGRVVCAPGSCAKTDGKEGKEGKGWICSSISGGRAATTPEGPVCDGECRAPEATECKKV
jgi:hypothetical protein